MIRRFGILAATAVALALSSSLLVDSPGHGAQPATPSVQPSARSIACTVKRLDLPSRRLVGIVGVGHALRIVRLDVAPACSASASGQAVPLRAVRPGDIVRVQVEPRPGLAVTPFGGVATRIDVVLAAPDRGRP